MPDTLVLPPDPVVGAGAGRRRPPPERSEPLLRALDQHPRLASRVLEAVDGRVGRLLLPLVAAGGLAELLEAPFDVEDIIHDLEGEPEIAPRLADRGHGRRVASGETRAHAERGADEGGGLVAGGVIRRGGPGAPAGGRTIGAAPPTAWARGMTRMGRRRLPPAMTL